MSWGHPPVQIAILAHDPTSSKLVESVVQRMGWGPDLVPASPQVTRDFARWELIVIAAERVTTEVLQQVTQASAPEQVRVLVVAEDREPQVIADVLRAGSDDYLASPFEEGELAARMQSLVLRARHLTERRRQNRLSIDPDTRTLNAGPLRVAFSRREWELLMVLLQNKTAPLSSEELASELNGNGISSATVTTLVSRIRRKLRDAGFAAIQVETIQGRGYLARFRRAADSITQDYNPGLFGRS